MFMYYTRATNSTENYLYTNGAYRSLPLLNTAPTRIKNDIFPAKPEVAFSLENLRRKNKKIIKKVLKSNFKDCFIESFQGFVCAYFKFEEVKLTDRKNNVHIIKNLWIKLLINPFEFTINKIEGTRTKYTNEEVFMRFSHSHLDAGALFGFTIFCLGTTDFMLHETLNEETFDLVIQQIKDFVSYEYSGSEGRPYQYLNNISHASLSYAQSDNKDDKKLDHTISLTSDTVKVDHFIPAGVSLDKRYYALPTETGYISLDRIEATRPTSRLIKLGKRRSEKVEIEKLEFNEDNYVLNPRIKSILDEKAERKYERILVQSLIKREDKVDYL